MKIRILLLGVTGAVARVLCEEGAAADVEVDVAADAEAAEKLLADPARHYHAIVAQAWENASGVAKTHLARNGQTTVQIAPAESQARELVRAIAAGALARAERQEMLLAMIAHDVRAPLGVALGALSEMTHPTLGPLQEEQQLLVRLATRSLARLQKTTHNVSALARIEAGRLEVTKAPADVAALVREVAHRIEREGDHQVKVEVDGAPATAPVDRERFSLAVDNVLSNAVRFAKSRVRVRVAPHAGGVEVVVEDDGPGLPANVADPFDRVGTALARPSKTGSGLGLAVVRGVLAAHGGEARAENVEGGGARVTLRIPAA
jgi:signal transduction histidine kinase